jgi:hypothetical protein
MWLRELSVWDLMGTATLIFSACRSDGPPETPPEAPSRDSAIVPLTVLSDTLAICRLDSRQPLPPWTEPAEGEFFSATRTSDELSIILPDSRAPRTVKCERGWRLLKVQGPLDFNLVGIIAGLSGTLADAGVSIFAMSTYNTDYLMVKQPDLERAVAALRQAGYPISQTY